MLNFSPEAVHDVALQATQKSVTSLLSAGNINRLSHSRRLEFTEDETSESEVRMAGDGDDGGDDVRPRLRTTRFVLAYTLAGFESICAESTSQVHQGIVLHQLFMPCNVTSGNRLPPRHRRATSISPTTTPSAAPRAATAAAKRIRSRSVMCVLNFNMHCRG